MDLWSRKIIGYAVISTAPTGIDACRIFNKIIAGKSLPNYISSDHDPLFEYKRWKANMRILEIKEIKIVREIPVYHPFIERTIQTTKMEYLDRTIFFSSLDLELRLAEFQKYYNEHRAHWSLNSDTPYQKRGKGKNSIISIDNYRWK